MKAKVTIDKNKDAKAKTYYCKSGDIIYIFNQDHGDVYLVKNSKDEIFSVHKDNLIIIKE